MLPAAAAPSFDGEGSSFFHYEQQVRLWGQVANSDPPGRASALILQMDTVASQGCMNAGIDASMSEAGADQILNTPRENFAPDAVDSVKQ